MHVYCAEGIALQIDGGMDGTKGFASRLRELREARGLTQETLARRADVTQNTVWRYESGQIQHPKMDVIERLARALDVDASALLEQMPPRRPTRSGRQERLRAVVEEVIASRPISEREASLLRSLRDLGEIEPDADLLWELVRAIRSRSPLE